MATKTIVELLDDTDPNIKADETVTFGLDGHTYEIDLSKKNANALRKVFAPYVDKGRKQGKPSKRHVSTGPDLKAVRAWAQSKGLQVSNRGRVSKEVLEQYKAAGN